MIDVGEELIEGRKVFAGTLAIKPDDPGYANGGAWLWLTLVKSGFGSLTTMSANGWKRVRTRREKREKVAGRRQLEMQIQGSTEVYIGSFSTGRG